MKAETRSSVFSCVFALALTVGCSKEAPPAAEQSRTPVVAASPIKEPPQAAAVGAAEPTPGAPVTTVAATGPAEPAPQAAEVSDATFALKIAAKGVAEVGKPAEAEIVLEAKEPFHVNDKYPYKFKLKEAPGLTFPAALVGKEAVKLEKARATMRVPFTAQSAGRHSLSGQFSFSVCTDDKCLIEKRELSLLVDAK